MSSSVTPYKESDLNKKKQVEKMFDTISAKYDGMNRLVSLGSDVRWRKKVIKMVLKDEPGSILDIATGTGDLAIQFAALRPGINVVGIDISEGMLSVARNKVSGNALYENLKFMNGDSEAMPFEDNSFEAITVSFGIRNFENLEKGLSEIFRVLKPGGKFVILETSVPSRFPFKQGYYIYARGIMPLMGRVLSKDKVAYKYLADSASKFPHGEELNNILRKIGFIEVENKPQTFGAASIYSASK